ncbi:hypothetical protein POM88_042944 [Heracleum sosnowskyi]|uniref:C2 domain-containing protein n=1 Tax=Heracleum sosnowskyi TaxID=360622 RepID=A0AAD8MCM0_9APIA|nr:hypothetical protein POM88_042944 [Heracleum sosnowskyi]
MDLSKHQGPEYLVLSVEERVAPREGFGWCAIPLQGVVRRLDNNPLDSEWLKLEKIVVISTEGDEKMEFKYSSWIQVKLCLEGGYHVSDECTQYNNDRRSTAEQLWKSSIGVLEVEILNGNGLSLMKTRDGKAINAYCVAKYGQKWVRTRTIIDCRPSPNWNEQYTWEVFDPCTIVHTDPDKNSPLVGYFPTSFDPFKDSGDSSEVNVYKNVKRSSRFQVVVKRSTLLSMLAQRGFFESAFGTEISSRDPYEEDGAGKEVHVLVEKNTTDYVIEILRLSDKTHDSEKVDVCVEEETVVYLNRKDVQKALHARLVGVTRWVML